MIQFDVVTVPELLLPKYTDLRMHCLQRRQLACYLLTHILLLDEVSPYDD